jgi:hypothetical protein
MFVSRYSVKGAVLQNIDTYIVVSALMPVEFVIRDSVDSAI